MKKQIIVTALACLVLASGAVTSVQAALGQADLDQRVEQSLQAATPLTLPAEAGRLVSQAKRADRVSTAVAAVKYALERQPTVAMVVLRTVVAAVPDKAPQIASAVVKLEPKRFKEILAAVAAGAPRYASKIVSTLCQEQPLKFAEIVIVVANQVPQAAPELLDALTESLPGTKPMVNNARSRNVGKQGFTITVAAANVTLAQVNQLAQIVANTLGGSGAFQAAAAAILRGDIVVDNAGKITSINTAKINTYTDVPADFKSNLQTKQTDVTTAVSNAADNPSSDYRAAVVNAGVAPTPIPVGDTVEVTDTKVRPYSN
jgi:hypothetical protein